MIIRSFLFIFIVLAFANCKTVMYGEEVESINKSISLNGVLFVKSWVFCNKISQVRKVAMKNALEKVLFNGVPNSSVKRPIINASAIKHKYQRYFDQLLSNEIAIKKYVSVTSIDPGDRIKVPGGWRVGVKCQVKYKELQKDLENDNIIKKFGL